MRPYVRFTLSRELSCDASHVCFDLSRLAVRTWRRSMRSCALLASWPMGSRACLAVLCLVYVSAYEWCLGCVRWQAPCFGIELSTPHPFHCCNKKGVLLVRNLRFPVLATC